MKIGRHNNQALPTPPAREVADAGHFVESIADVVLHTKDVRRRHAVAFQDPQVILVAERQLDAVAFGLLVHCGRIFGGDHDVGSHFRPVKAGGFEGASRLSSGKHNDGVGRDRAVVHDENIRESPQRQRIAEVDEWNQQQENVQENEFSAALGF